MLTQMGHPQLAKQLQADNNTAKFSVHENINQNKFKSWYMRFDWLRNKQQNHNLEYIGVLVTITFLNITPSITQRNITKTPEKHM